MELQVDREVAAPPQRIWAIVTDLEGSPSVLSAVQAVERLDDRDEFGVGTRWRETRVMFGREATEEMVVTAVEPGRAYTVTAVNGGTTYTSVIRVEPLGEDRAMLTMTFAATSTGAAARVLGATVGRLFLGATRKACRQDLDDIAAAAERPAAN